VWLNELADIFECVSFDPTLSVLIGDGDSQEAIAFLGEFGGFYPGYEIWTTIPGF
jgi:hypothetical protein